MTYLDGARPLGPRVRMNRADRRRLRRIAKDAPAVAAFAESYRCPDCISDQTLIPHGGRLFTLRVAHNDTCPTLRAMEARR